MTSRLRRLAGVAYKLQLPLAMWGKCSFVCFKFHVASKRQGNFNLKLENGVVARPVAFDNVSRSTPRDVICIAPRQQCYCRPKNSKRATA